MRDSAIRPPVRSATQSRPPTRPVFDVLNASPRALYHTISFIDTGFDSHLARIVNFSSCHSAGRVHLRITAQ